MHDTHGWLSKDEGRGSLLIVRNCYIVGILKSQLVKDSVVPIAVVQVVVDVESGLFGAPIHGGESRSSEEEKVD